jgi:tetratricopeptide (TPR) repeat protein
MNIDDGDGTGVRIALINLATLYASTSPARSIVPRELVLELAEALRDQEHIAITHLFLMWDYAWAGLFERAEASYAAFQRLPTPASRATYRLGDAEFRYCWLRFFQGTLTDQLLRDAESAAEDGNSRVISRMLLRLRGEFALQRGNLSNAITGFEKCIEMTQAAGMSATDVEARLALALARKGDLEQARRVLERVREPAPGLELAELYLELGDREKARHHALVGYGQVWADGPTYSYWWYLKRCRAVLEALGEPEPKLPAYDPNTAEPIPHEAERPRPDR